MTRLAKLAAPFAIAAAVVITPAPAKAQFDEGQMAQFAPMLEMMKQKMGKKRFGQMMQTMGPMMENMMGQGGGGGFGGGDFGNGRLRYEQHVGHDEPADDEQHDRHVRRYAPRQRPFRPASRPRPSSRDLIIA